MMKSVCLHERVPVCHSRGSASGWRHAILAHQDLQIQRGVMRFESVASAGELSRIMTVAWSNDSQNVVLEVSENEGKTTVDAARCSWRQLFEELQDLGSTDFTINSHDIVPPSVDGG